MIKPYMLKPEARQFFRKSLQTEVKSLEDWKKETVPIELLNEAPRAFLLLGARSSESSTNLCGHSYETHTSQFNFTVYVRNTSGSEYNQLRDGELIDFLQDKLNDYLGRIY